MPGTTLRTRATPVETTLITIDVTSAAMIVSRSIDPFGRPAAERQAQARADRRRSCEEDHGGVDHEADEAERQDRQRQREQLHDRSDEAVDERRR